MTGNQLMLDLVDGKHTLWQVTKKTDDSCRQLADRHYSRQTVGAVNFCRPGRNYVLRTLEANSVWVSYYSKYRDDKFDAIECTLFRNESSYLSSELILLASLMSFQHFGESAPKTIITYVKADSVKSSNAGYCYLKAGYRKLKHTSSRGLLTYEISYEDLLNEIRKRLSTSEWLKRIEAEVQNINTLHQQMNEAFAEYELDFAITFAVSAANAYTSLKAKIETMLGAQFDSASHLLKLYCAHYFDEMVNIDDLYNTLLDWQSIEATEELHEAVRLIEEQYILLNNKKIGADSVCDNRVTIDFNTHLLNWISEKELNEWIYGD